MCYLAVSGMGKVQTSTFRCHEVILILRWISKNVVDMLLNDASVVFYMIVSAQQSPLTKGQKKEIKQVPSAAKSQTMQINKRNTQQLRIIQQIQHGNLGAKDLNTLLHSDTDSVICKDAGRQSDCPARHYHHPSSSRK